MKGLRTLALVAAFAAALTVSVPEAAAYDTYKYSRTDSYVRQAQSSQRQAKSYRSSAETYKRDAERYQRDAAGYTRRGEADKAKDYNRRADNAIDKYRDYISRAERAEREAADYYRRAASTIEQR